MNCPAQKSLQERSDDFKRSHEYQREENRSIDRSSTTTNHTNNTSCSSSHLHHGHSCCSGDNNRPTSSFNENLSHQQHRHAPSYKNNKMLHDSSNILREINGSNNKNNYQSTLSSSHDTFRQTYSGKENFSPNQQPERRNHNKFHQSSSNEKQQQKQQLTPLNSERLRPIRQKTR